MVEFILFVLFVAILLYGIFGGADYGAGILEIFKGSRLKDEQSKVIYKAIGPVWEANHVWLILILVIMFNGFPKIFYHLSVSLHIPLAMLMVGVIGRGTAFTFRHYDAYKGKVHKLYDLIFSFSSLWSTFWLGIIVGALIFGRIQENPGSFLDAFVRPWLNSFSFMVGIFSSSLFTYLASIFLIGETEIPELQKKFRERSYYSNIFCVTSGSFILFDGLINNVRIIQNFIVDPISLTSFILATILLGVQWYVDRVDMRHYLKYLGVIQFTLIIVGLGSVMYPTFLTFQDTGTSLSFYNSAAPTASLMQLVYALIGGVLIIFPSLIYLFVVFKKKES